MAENSLKPGDVVQLKSHSYPMTIGYISKTAEPTATCFWAHEGEVRNVVIPVAALQLWQKRQTRVL